MPEPANSALGSGIVGEGSEIEHPRAKRDEGEVSFAAPPREARPHMATDKTCLATFCYVGQARTVKSAAAHRKCIAKALPVRNGLAQQPFLTHSAVMRSLAAALLVKFGTHFAL